MTVPVVNIPKPIIAPSARVPFTGEDGVLSNTGLQFCQSVFTAINGLSPTITCNAVFASNKYTLTPVNIAPRIPNYYDHWSFAFVAPATSTGLVTATIVPETGILPTLPVYKTNGSAQATTNDITVNLFYVLYYVDSLNSGNGGFVLK